MSISLWADGIKGQTTVFSKLQDVVTSSQLMSQQNNSVVNGFQGHFQEMFKNVPLIPESGGIVTCDLRIKAQGRNLWAK